MYFKSKKTSLLILLLTAIAVSIFVVVLLNDSLNQTIVNGVLLAVMVYILSLAAYLFDPSTSHNDLGNQIDPIGVSVLEHVSLVPVTGIKRLLLAVLIQVIIAAGFFLYWN